MFSQRAVGYSPPRPVPRRRCAGSRSGLAMGHRPRHTVMARRAMQASARRQMTRPVRAGRSWRLHGRGERLLLDCRPVDSGCTARALAERGKHGACRGARGEEPSGVVAGQGRARCGGVGALDVGAGSLRAAQAVYGVPVVVSAFMAGVPPCRGCCFSRFPEQSRGTRARRRPGAARGCRTGQLRAVFRAGRQGGQGPPAGFRTRRTWDTPRSSRR